MFNMILCFSQHIIGTYIFTNCSTTYSKIKNQDNIKMASSAQKLKIKYHIFILFLSLLSCILNILLCSFSINIHKDSEHNKTIHQCHFIIKHFMIPITILSLFIFLFKKYLVFPNKQLGLFKMCLILIISYLIQLFVIVLMLLISKPTDPYNRENEPEGQEENFTNKFNKLNNIEGFHELVGNALFGTKFHLNCYNEDTLMIINFFTLLSFVFFYIVFRNISYIFEYE